MQGLKSGQKGYGVEEWTDFRTQPPNTFLFCRAPSTRIKTKSGCTKDRTA